MGNRSATYIGTGPILQAKNRPGVPARVSEHVRCLLHSSGPDGNRPRYVVGRKIALSYLRSLPLIYTLRPEQVLGFEGLLIAMEALSANRRGRVVACRDNSTGRRLPLKGRCKRPSKWIRQKSYGVRHNLISVWSLPVVMTCVTKKCTEASSELREQFPGIFGAQLG